MKFLEVCQYVSQNKLSLTIGLLATLWERLDAFYNHFVDLRIEAYKNQVTCPNSRSKLEVELSYKYKICNLITCEFMSQGMLIQYHTMSTSIRGFLEWLLVLRERQGQMSTSSFTSFKIQNMRACLFVLGLCILYIKLCICLRASWHLLIIQAEF